MPADNPKRTQHWCALPPALFGKIRVCVFASCIPALRWNLVGSTGRIAQSPDKSSNFEQPGKVMHLHFQCWRRTRAAERRNHLAST